jgi:BON domain
VYPHSLARRALTCTVALMVAAPVTVSSPAAFAQKAPPSDNLLTVKVENALNAEHVFQGMRIIVTVSKGVVTLSGFVTSDAAKVLASEQAGGVTGVKTVLNNLTVQQPGTPAVPAPAPMRPASVAAAPIQTLPRSVVLGQGTYIPIRVTDPISSKTAKPNDEFHGTVAGNVFQSNLVLIPSGASVLGRVVETKEAGHFVGQALLTIELVSIRLPSPEGPQNVSLVTEPLSSKANGRGANTAEKTAGGAGVGALIGALAGGGKGAGIGALAGGGLGAGANAITRGQEINVRPETLLRFRTAAPLQVTVMMRGNMQLQLPAPAGPALRDRPVSPDATPTAPTTTAPNTETPKTPQ